MKSIMGLVYKDLMNLSTVKKTLIVLTIFLTLGFATSGKVTIVSIMLFGVIGMLILSSFSYDEIANSEKYMLTLPVTKKDVVISKYVLKSILNISGLLIGFLVGMILKVVLEHADVGDNILQNIPTTIQLIESLAGAYLGISLVQLIQIPCALKYGGNKGRLMIFVILAIIGAVIVGIGALLNVYGVFHVVVDFMNNLTSTTFSAILFSVIMVLVLTIISYIISYKAYLKREL